jgi:glycosyltransferase involved in cell wall biosynthesis
MPLMPHVIPNIQVVTTYDGGSMDCYGRELAARLPVPELRLHTEGASMETFGAPALSLVAARSVVKDRQLVRALRSAASMLHITHHHMARYAPASGRPFILTVHDIIRWRDLTGADCLISRPTARDAMGLRRDFAGYLKARAIIAVSQFTKDDLVTFLHIPPHRITVVHEGIDHSRFRPHGSRPVADPYILYVGSEHPRKNVVTLLQAFARLKADPAWSRYRLVKVGSSGASEGRFRERTRRAVSSLGLTDDVIFTGYVDDRDLPAYYTHAECFVLPSLYEGFGFPPIEAMACGCPVIVSSAGSLPEVTRGAALVVDPTDVDELTGAMRQLLSDHSLRSRLTARGFERAQDFSWDKAAALTLEVYQRACAGERSLQSRASSP